MAYKINILSSKEFDKVVKSNSKYEHASDSLGFADPEAGQAYVLNTKWDELNSYLIEHEFEHLLNPSNKVHEDEHGIHHKKGREILSNIVQPILTVIGGAIGGPVGAAAGGTIGGGISGATSGGRGLGRKFGKGVGIGALSGAGGAAGGGLGAGIGQAVGQKTIGGQSTGQSILSGIGQGTAFKTGVGLKGGTGSFGQGAPTGATAIGGTPTPAGTLPGLPGTPQPSGTLNLGGSTVTSPQQGQLAGAGVAAPQAPSLVPSGPQAQTGGPGPGGIGGGIQKKGIFDKFKESLFGSGGERAEGGGGFGLGQLAQVGAGLGLAGAPALGGFGPQTPEVPNFRDIPSIQQLTQTAGEAQTPLGAAARTALGGRLKQEFGGANEAITAQINRTFDQQRQQLESQFKQFRPNADIATDSGLRRAVFDLENRRAESLGQAEQTEFTRFQEQQRQDIGAALGVDQGTLQTLGSLAQLDILQIQTQLGLDAQEATNFKQSFGEIGGLFVQSGLGLNSFGGTTNG